MSIRFWLRPGKEVADRFVNFASDYGLKLNEKSEETTGEQYVEVYQNVLNPTNSIPDIPEELLDRVTVRDTITNFHCLRKDGLYELGGAKLLAETNVHSYGDGMYGMNESRTQEVYVTAPTFAKLREILRQFRNGTILPEEDWTAEQMKKPTQTTVTAETSPSEDQSTD